MSLPPFAARANAPYRHSPHPLDPRVASRLADEQNLDAEVWSGATGLDAAAHGTETPSEGSSVDATGSDSATCCCEPRGFRGLRRDGACLE